MGWVERFQAEMRRRRQLRAALEEKASSLIEANERLRVEAAERASAEEAISRVAREWTATFDTISDFVSVHDREFRIVRANRALASLLGLHPRDVVGRTCHDLFHGTAEPWPECPHRRAVESGDVTTAEVCDPKIGVPLLVTCSPFFDGEGCLVGTVHVARDISAQKCAEAEREKLIGELQSALAAVHVLSGILPICASCKKIRDEEGQWHPIESYVSSRSEARFSHGVCPECARRLYPGYAD